MSKDDSKVHALPVKRKLSKDAAMSETARQLLAQADASIKDGDSFTLLVTFRGEEMDDITYSYVGASPAKLTLLGTLELIKSEFIEKYAGRIPAEED